MADDWKTIPLTDLYDIGSGLSKPRSEFGFGQGFLTFKDVLDNYFVPDELSALVNSTEKEQANCSVMRGDVFLTRTSETQPELGMSSVALRDYPNATFNGFTKRLRPRTRDAVVPECCNHWVGLCAMVRNLPAANRGRNARHMRTSCLPGVCGHNSNDSILLFPTMPSRRRSGS